MDCIINPSWFYWIDVLGGVDTMFDVLFSLSAAVFVVAGGFWFLASENEDDDIDIQKLTLKVVKVLKVSGIIFAISVLASIFIPNEETMYKMMIAQYATTDNVETIIDTIDEKADKIIEILADDDDSAGGAEKTE